MSKGRLALGVLGSRGSRGHQPTTPVREGKEVETTWGRRSGGPGTGAHHADHLETGAQYWSSPSLLVFCLQQPGLQWVQSFFCYQSSFFGRHLGQILSDNPRDTTVMVYSGGIQSGQQICPLWARVDWGCDTPSGWCGGTGGTPSHS